MLRSIKNIRGFTLPEVLASVVIMIFVFFTTVALYIMLDRMWRSNFALNELTSNTGIAAEKIIRGYVRKDGVQQPGVEEAKGISQPAEGSSSNILEYKDLNDQTRNFHYSLGKIYTESDDVLLSNVESAVFSNMGDTVKIEINTNKNLGYKDIRLHLETNIKPRNAG